MRFTSISISNFKGLREATLAMSPFGCLVGENNAGKSSVLQAIVQSLNRPANISPELFYDTTQPVTFVIRFDDISEADLSRLAPEHQARITDVVTSGSLSLRVRYSVGQKCETTIQKSVPIDAKYQADFISTLLTGKKGAAVVTAVRETYPEFAAEMPAGLTITSAKTFLTESISQLPDDQFTKAYVPLPSGIPASISALLPEPIYIPAVKNLGDDLKTTQSTPFGRLLGLLLEDMAPDLGRVNASLNELNTLLNRLQRGEGEDSRHHKVIELENVVERFLGENFPKVKLELHVPPPELKTILNSAQIYVDDGSRDLIDNKGDGIKRSLTFALLQTFVYHQAERHRNEVENTVPQRPLLFLFEEPELYLHPKSQRVLFKTLARISRDHQVVVTTHSPMFFEPGVTASFVRVAKRDAEPKPVGVLHPVNLALDDENSEVFRLARFENADAAFFSRRVVLFEGESDDFYCKHLSKMFSAEWDFDQRNVALVRVSGKGNFSKYRRFFEAFGIEVKIVADLDALFEGHQHLGGEEQFTHLRAAAIQTIDGQIKALFIPAEPAARQIKDKAQSQSWKSRYNTAKVTLQSVKDGAEVTPEIVALIDGLFTWEEGTARIKACREDAISAAALVPVFDHLRQFGICVLARGAIEDYYPAGVEHGSKPERALAAARLVTTADQAAALCTPLGDGRNCELHEIFEEIFRDLS